MIKPKFIARVKNGRLAFLDQSAFNSYLWQFKADEDLDVTVSKRRKDRSTNQNNWYWGAVLPTIAHATGHTSEELHEVYKRLFLKKKVITYHGRDIPIPGSTTEADTAEFTEYIERIRAHAAMELGINIPDPQAYDE